jgi:hypothetical protein
MRQYWPDGDRPPTAGELRSAAQTLRDSARQLTNTIKAYEQLLDPAVNLATGDTWQGPYPDQTNAQIATWHSSLADVSVLQSRAAAWVQAAGQMEHDADVLDKAKAPA